MTDHGGDERRWLDFAHTAVVLTASALAQEEIANGRGAPRIARFAFDLLAAADPGQVTLPGRLTASGNELSATVEEGSGEIRVVLQLKGFGALKENAGRAGRLVSVNGAIDYAFRFGERGSALCVLAETPAIRDGLKAFSVFVEQA